MLMLVLERAGKGRFCPFWHKKDGPAAKSQSNPCESNREAARRHAQVRAWRAGLTDSRAKGIQRWALAPPTVFWEEDRNCRYHPRFSAALAVVFSIDKRWGVQHPMFYRSCKFACNGISRCRWSGVNSACERYRNL